jgi:uncharacterized membrane protein YccF (DUF307 family)
MHDLPPQQAPVRAAMLGFALSYLLALVLLGDLLGSSADSTAAFTEHFDSAATRAGDILGCLALLASSASLAALGVILRVSLRSEPTRIVTELLPTLATLGAAGLLVAAGLLSTAPLMRTLGDWTGDPGLEPSSEAGVAQAGTAVLVLTLIIVGVWSALAGLLAHREAKLGRSIAIVGLLCAALTVFGLSVVAAFPIGIWWLVVGITWGRGGRRKVPAPGTR